jgi:hypothetical protein
MSDILTKPCTVFDGTRRLASGPLAEVAPHFKLLPGTAGILPALSFSDASGRPQSHEGRK